MIKRIVSILCLLLIFSSVHSLVIKPLDDSDDIIIAPPSPINSNDVQKVLIFFQGANVPNTDYVYLSALQQTVPIKMWIVLLQFPLNYADPLFADKKISDSINYIKQNGFPTCSNADVFLGGHSLGGVVARGSAVTAIKKNIPYAGIILYGSYLDIDGDYSLSNFEGSVLTLGGSLDGLTTITFLSQIYVQFQNLAQQNYNKTASYKPVIILENVRHSQFDTTVDVKGDLPGYLNVSLDQAHEMIITATSAFFINNINSPTISNSLRSDALSEILNEIDITQSLVNPFLTAQITEKTNLCILGQYNIANLSLSDNQRLNISEKLFSDEGDFEKSKPSVVGKTDPKTGQTIADIQTYAYNLYSPNPFEVSSVSIAAQDAACKMKTQDAIKKALISSSSGISGSCQTINTQEFNYSVNLLLEDQRNRYFKYGKQLQFDSDDVKTTGSQWVNSHVNVKQSKTNPNIYEVTSTSLVTDLKAPFGLDGMYYCKLFSPARAVEWMLVESLKQ
eukprot:TRINITY_DN3985_c0_g1_i1.p1 TRINITY_DN3985_c0_g1~~TRINITY_DN3985_c0_g1_i1.p1  ORF type:complete len:519 (+),score=228.61 TRINITY_DN3985_c0_g1_i1:40-1557(+)